jgi:hypothetical protein
MSDQLPVKWEDEMKASAKALMETERPALSIMSLKSGVMTIADEPVPGNELECIIVASVTENCFYETKYDANVRTNPVCYALGEGRAEDQKPHAESTKPQHTDCGTCPNFEWGSDPNGGRGKACKERRRLALIPADGTAEMVLLSIPPTSLKNWANFAREVVATTGKPPMAVIAKVKLVPSVKSMIEVKFEILRPVPDDRLALVFSKRAAALETMLAPYPEIEEEQVKKEGKKKKY